MGQAALFDRINFEIDPDALEELRKGNRDFGGATYDPKKDKTRLTTQLAQVRHLMIDGRKRTLAQIAQLVGGSEAGVSARLRDLRKSRHGSYIVQRARIAGGLWVYWIERL